MELKLKLEKDKSYSFADLTHIIDVNSKFGNDYLVIVNTDDGSGEKEEYFKSCKTLEDIADIIIKLFKSSYVSKYHQIKMDPDFANFYNKEKQALNIGAVFKLQDYPEIYMESNISIHDMNSGDASMLIGMLKENKELEYLVKDIEEQIKN